MIKWIKEQSRKDIRKLLNSKVHLELWIKVKKIGKTDRWICKRSVTGKTVCKQTTLVVCFLKEKEWKSM